ncbi:pyridoxal phosphate-dependent aminotransferase [bacterium]|nr:pyridoxal phosphate-dependent aminotransferase [bacterium]
MKFSNRIERVEESLTIGMAKKARELKASGKDVINLSLGEPDFDTPDHIKEAAIQAIRDGKTKYPPVGGIPELKQAICDKFKRENGLDYSPNEVMVSTGAKQCIMNCILSLVQTGDEVIIPLPYWVSYSEMVRFSGAEPVFVPSIFEEGFKLDLAALESKINNNTRLIIFSSPSNPSGSVMSREELRGIADIVKKNPQITVISDEIYEHILFNSEFESISQFSEIKDQLVIINGVSKAFSMTGWRIGYMAGPKEIVAACDKLQGQFTSGANHIAQWAAVAALNTDLASTKEMVNIFKHRRDLLLDEFKDLSDFEFDKPGGAFYLFPRVSKCFGKKYGDTLIKDSMDLAAYILEHALVSVVPGIAFGMPDHIRISYASGEQELLEAVKRIKKVMSHEFQSAV